jgi:phosphatidylglycerophosphatase A
VNALLLWLAQGFGIGRIPKAPGTFGSLVGLGWFALLLWSGSFWIYFLGCLVGIALSIWLCGAGEKILNARDPGSIVFDEIAAIPICFFGWVASREFLFKVSHFPHPEYFFSKQHILPTLGVFAAFRFFDVWKPWPVRQSQSLPGGWGVTIDDVLAAVYVNVVVLIVMACSHSL